MKQALTIGCGSGNSKIIVDTLLANDYTVTNIGHSAHPDCDNISVSWQHLDITNLHKIYSPPVDQLDFVFFNQNASSLDIESFDLDQDTLRVWKLMKDWQHSHWISCQMPLLLLHYLGNHLNADSKVGWMLSSMMCHDREGTESFPDYSSQKYFNYLAMKSLARHYETFGIMPNFERSDSSPLLAKIISEVCKNSVRAKVFKMS